MRLTILFLFISSFCCGQITVSQSPLYYNFSADNSYQIYLNAITTAGLKPGPLTVQIAQNDFISDLKVAGFWTRMKIGYFFHAGSRDVALINMKDPATFALTVGGGAALQPIYIQGVGQRPGGNTYFRSTYKANQYSGIETDLTIAAYYPDEPFASQYVAAFYSTGVRGLSSSANSFQMQIPYFSASTGYRGQSTGSLSFTSNTHKGLMINTYDGANSVVWKDGTKSSTAATPAVPNLTNDRLIFAANTSATNAGLTVTGYYNRLMSAYFLFDRFSDADELAFRNIWTKYNNAINLDFKMVSEYASHCWFTRNKSAYDAGTNLSWLGQCHSDAFNSAGYSQYIFQINNTTNAITKFKLGTVNQQDDHNEPSILIRTSDSKLVCVYSEHTGSLIRWRISTNALDASAWGSESTKDPDPGDASLYTYPSVFESASGNLYVFFRRSLGVNQWCYMKSTDGGATFGNSVLLTNITYSAIAQDPTNKNKLHFICTEHPDEGIYPNYVGSFYFDASTDTAHKTDGTSLTLPIDFTTAGSAMSIIRTNSSPEGCWLEDITVDGSGNPRVLFNVIPDNTTTAILKDQYYSEWNGSAWTTPYLLQRSATHYMETEILASSLLSKWYAPLGSFDRANPNRIFTSVETAGHFGNVCEIWELNRVSSSSFTRLQRTFDSANDQWRPFTIESPTNNVFWLNKIYYDHWLTEYFQTLVLRTY